MSIYGAQDQQRFDPRGLPQGNEQQWNHQLAEMEAAADDPQTSGNVQPQDMPTYHWARWGGAMAIILVVVLALFAYFYFTTWKGDSVSVKTSVEGGTLDPTFNSLSVKNNTTLGTNSGDKINLRGAIESDMLPTTSHNIGSETQTWGDVWVDNVKFDNGTCITSETNSTVLIDGSLQYRSRVIDFPLTTGQETTLNKTDSGSIYRIYPVGVFPASGPSIILPNAEGSGRRYEFIASEDIYTAHFYSADESKMYGRITVVSEPAVDGSEQFVYGGTSLATFPSTENSYEVFVDSLRPNVDGTFGATNVLKGSRLNFVDYADGVWNVDGNILIESGISAGSMITPFSTAPL